MSNPNPHELNAEVVINGAQKFTVTYLPDKDGLSKTEEVMVRLIPVSKIGEYLSKIGVIEQLVELLTGKEAGWADTLSDDSLYAIDSLGRKINDPRLDRYVRRQTEAVSSLAAKAQNLAGLTNSLQTQ